MGVQDRGRLPERQLRLEPDVDQVPQVGRHADVRARRSATVVRTMLAQMAAEPFGDEGQPVLGLEFLACLVEGQVQLVNAPPQQRVGQHGVVDRRADEARRQLRKVEVDHSFAEAAELFATGNDRDNRAAVRAVSGEKLDLVGIAVYGPRNAVDKITKGARMHQ